MDNDYWKENDEKVEAVLKRLRKAYLNSLKRISKKRMEYEKKLRKRLTADKNTESKKGRKATTEKNGTSIQNTIDAPSSETVTRPYTTHGNITLQTDVNNPVPIYHPNRNEDPFSFLSSPTRQFIDALPSSASSTYEYGFLPESSTDERRHFPIPAPILFSTPGISSPTIYTAGSSMNCSALPDSNTTTCHTSTADNDYSETTAISSISMHSTVGQMSSISLSPDPKPTCRSDLPVITIANTPSSYTGPAKAHPSASAYPSSSYASFTCISSYNSLTDAQSYGSKKGIVSSGKRQVRSLPKSSSAGTSVKKLSLKNHTTTAPPQDLFNSDVRSETTKSVSSTSMSKPIAAVPSSSSGLYDCCHVHVASSSPRTFRIDYVPMTTSPQRSPNSNQPLIISTASSLFSPTFISSSTKKNNVVTASSTVSFLEPQTAPAGTGCSQLSVPSTHNALDLEELKDKTVSNVNLKEATGTGGGEEMKEPIDQPCLLTGDYKQWIRRYLR